MVTPKTVFLTIVCLWVLVVICIAFMKKIAPNAEWYMAYAIAIGAAESAFLLRCIAQS